MTHRQRVGLVVLSAAVVLVAVVAGLRPPLVTGAAQAAPVPGPPAVGDCVLDPLVPPKEFHVTAASGGTVPVYPAQQIRPCTAARYGEITSVIPTPKPSVVKGDDLNGRYLVDPNQNSCVPGVMEYMGMTTQPIQRFWRMSLPQVRIGLSSPSPLQKAAGQHWVACLVTFYPPDPASTPATQTPTSPRYSSSIRNAVQTGWQRDQLGNCMSAAVSWNNGITSSSCSRPHALEILVYGDSGDHPVTRLQLEQTCQQAVRQLTAMADPTAAGALSIQIHVEDNNGAPVTTPQVPAYSNLLCGVTTTGNRKLRGSLLALGRQPIPWAS